MSPRTATEDLLKQIKRTKRSKAILVPLIENFMQNPIEIEDDEDREFLRLLVLARSQPRKKGIYSPSMLASCVRQVYFVKNGVEQRRIPRAASNAIFADGNFRHFKWQFIMWKMHRAGIIQLVDAGTICIGSEIFVVNKTGDYGGTIDTLVYIPSHDLLTTVDWKGMNGSGFQNALYKSPSIRYTWQVVGYAGLANETIKTLPKKIDYALIIGENKNGAVNNRQLKSPLGLKEWHFKVSDYQPDVAKRLKRLRAYEKKNETPPPECVSTRRQGFKDCAFSYLCRGEVEKIEKRKLRKLKKKKPSELKPQFNRKRNDGSRKAKKTKT